jgi:ABC-type Fe3+/spermidine/putrescine transport system ATPase subunit
LSNLSLNGIGKRFGEVRAVRDFTLELAEGEFVSLLGPSGCGKTTTLRMIAGFIDPSEGEITIGGRIMSSPRGSVPPEKRNMSMIFQSYAIWPNMTVAENVGFGLSLRRLPKAEMEARINRFLDVVQMRHLRDRYPAELSGGQQQRVALARAMVVQPQVLLLDEPLSNLDANLREEMRFEIRRLHDEFRITTVYVTHDQGEAMVTSDRIVVMSQGRVEQVADPFTLYTRPETRFVAGFIGRTNFVDAEVSSGRLRFLGTEMAAGLLPQAARFGGRASLSIRPHDVGMTALQPPASDGMIVLRGQVAERAYLGDHWEYAIQMDGTEAQLRVTAPPHVGLDVDATAWLTVDPGHIVALPADDARSDRAA